MVFFPRFRRENILYGDFEGYFWVVMRHIFGGQPRRQQQQRRQQRESLAPLFPYLFSCVCLCARTQTWASLSSCVHRDKIYELHVGMIFIFVVRWGYFCPSAPDRPSMAMGDDILVRLLRDSKSRVRTEKNTVLLRK